MSRRTRLAGAALAAVLGVSALSGCGTTLGDLPLPGTKVSGDTMTLTMEFEEALNLAKGAPVKVNGVDSGKVQDVRVEDFHAVADIELRTDAELRRGATARLRYTTPLGELFVDVVNPPEGELIRSGEQLSLPETDTAPTVEDALSQASLLINGGGLAQLQTVTEELNAAFGGREDVFRRMLDQTNEFLIAANSTTADIDHALRAMNSVALTLQQREAIINRALKEIRPASKVLRERIPDFRALLQQLQTFSATANEVVGQTRADLLAMIRTIEPILAEFASNQGRWKDSLDQLVRLADGVDAAIPGDYLNVKLDLHLTTLLTQGSGGLLSGGGGGGGGGNQFPDLGLDGLLDGVLGGLLGRTTAAPTGEVTR